MKRCCGIIAHPTSFPSKYGIGDLGRGAYDFIDYCYDCGQELIQVLPLGPTIYCDSPYQSFSTFAGNTLLISPDILAEEGYLKPIESPEPNGSLYPPCFDDHTVDYGPVIEYKTGLYDKAYAKFLTDATVKQKQAYELFVKENSFWLEEYALFRAIKSRLIEERRREDDGSESLLKYAEANKNALSENEIRDYYYGAVWNSWPAELTGRDPAALDEIRVILARQIGRESFLQYEFFRQWKKFKEYANSLGIGIIGDIPIFVAMDSSDTWSNPELFYLDKDGYPELLAGVPPDYFSKTGQLWGNPLYNWLKHRETGYKWWIRRIERALGLVDILRIDHFRGFDEYWAIPRGEKTAINGEWRKGPGMDLFNAVRNELGDASIIAEDLGILTDSVTELRKKAGYPGMKVLQFAFSDPKNEYLPHEYTDTDAVVYTGTHDNDTTIGWYLSATEKERDYFRRYMNVSGDDVNWDLIRLAWSSNAKYAITPLQDLLGFGSEGRMNTPGEPSGWWRWRFTGDMLNDYIKDRLLYIGRLFNRLPKRLETEEADEDREDVDDAAGNVCAGNVKDV